MATTTRPFLCTLGIKTKQAERFRCATHCEEILRRLQSRLDLSDVVLVAGSSGKRIAAHRFFLIACSEYFSDLFGGSIGVGQQREVILNNIDGDAMEKLIKYCYSGSLDLEGDTIESLLITANHLRLEKAVEACCDFLQRHLQSSNSLDVAFFAEQLNLDALLHNTRKFICKNFEEVCNQPKFLLINAEQLSKLIDSDDLCGPSDEFIFEVITKWIEYEPETRRKHFPDLLAQMRLSRLSQSFLLTKVEPLCNETKTLKLVMNALKSQPQSYSTQKQPGPTQEVSGIAENIGAKLVFNQPTKNLRRTVVKTLLAIDIQYIPQNFMNIMSYNLRTKNFMLFSTPIKGISSFASVFMDDKLIIAGGMLNDSRINTVTSLNLRTMYSTQMAPLRTARSNHRVAVLNGSVYVIGGVNSSNKRLNLVEKFDSVSGTWNLVASTKHLHLSPNVAVLNDQLYVSSNGYAANGKYETYMESYDPVKNVWSSLAPMQVARHSYGFAAYKGYLFVFCGDTNGFQNAVERYDPRTNTWKNIPCKPSFSGYICCTSLGSDLFVYNNLKIYMIDNEGCCDNLEFRLILSEARFLCNTHDFAALPYELNAKGLFIHSNVP